MGADDFSLANGGEVDFAFRIIGEAGRSDGTGTSVGFKNVKIRQKGYFLRRGDVRGLVGAGLDESLGEVGAQITRGRQIEIVTGVSEVGGI